MRIDGHGIRASMPEDRIYPQPSPSGSGVLSDPQGRYRLSQAGESWPWGRQATGLCISSVIPLLIVIFVLCVVYLLL